MQARRFSIPLQRVDKASNLIVNGAFLALYSKSFYVLTVPGQNIDYNIN